MRLTQANSKAVEYACKHFHYSLSVPAVQFAYNVYNEQNEWCGCILFGGGANNNLAKSFGKNAGEVLELERVALNGKQEHTSQAVAMALKQCTRMTLCAVWLYPIRITDKNISARFIRLQIGSILD